MAIIAPACLGMVVLSPEIVNIPFGPIWAPVTLPLLILCFYGLFRAMIDFSSSLFGAVGKPRIIAELNLYILLLSLVPLFPLTLLFGINGTSVATTVPVAIVALLSIFRSAGILQGRTRELYARLRGPLAAAEGMAVVVFGFRLLLYDVLPTRIPFPFSSHGISENTIVLGAGVAVGMLVYFMFLLIGDRKTILGMRRTLASVLRRRQLRGTRDATGSRLCTRSRSEQQIGTQC